MRPFPPSRHWLAAVLLTLVAAGSAYFASEDWRCDDAQIRALTALQKQADGELYGGDFVFGPSGAWRFQSPAFQSLLRWLAPLGAGELAPFRALTGWVVLLYLGGMYALLYRQTRSWPVSTFVAVLSMTVIHSLGGAYWGVGSLASITPYGIVTACAPLVVLAFLHQEGKHGLLLVFAWVGLLANLDVPAAGNLAIVLLLVHLAQGRFRLRVWPRTLACGLAALVGAAPILWYRWELARRVRPAGAGVVASAVRHAADLADWEALYPRLLEGVWTWLLVIAMLLVISAVILAREERFGVRNFAAWVWWILGALTVTFVFQGAAQLCGWAWGRPATVGYAGASALVLLPLYILLAHALTTLFRIYRSHRVLARWGCAFFAAAWMAPSDNCRVLRYAISDTTTVFMTEVDKPRYVQKHHERYIQWRERCDIAAWARRNTPLSAVLVCDSAELRLRSRRGALACRDDVESLYRFEPWGLADWAEALERQEKALRAPGREPLDALGRDFSLRPPTRGAEEWYVVLRSSDPAARELPPVPPAGWGRYYVLCRLR